MCIWRKPPSSLFLQTLRGSAAFPGVQVTSQTLHLLQCFEVCLDTAREYSLILTSRTSAFGGPNSGNWILTWGSSFGHGKVAWRSPSQILHEKPAVEQLGMPPWQDKQRGSPNPAFTRVPGQWHGAVWTDNPKETSCPNSLRKKLMSCQ